MQGAGLVGGHDEVDRLAGTDVDPVAVRLHLAVLEGDVDDDRLVAAGLLVLAARRGGGQHGDAGEHGADGPGVQPLHESSSQGERWFSWTLRARLPVLCQNLMVTPGARNGAGPSA